MAIRSAIFVGRVAAGASGFRTDSSVDPGDSALGASSAAAHSSVSPSRSCRRPATVTCEYRACTEPSL
jgi:hypothetical protein